MDNKQPVNIIGAGLAGLTAAVILARQGREVTVYEKGNRVGGMSLYNPSPHGTPMDPERMSAYVGFDVRPGMEPMPKGCLSIFGKRYPKDWPTGAPCWMIERGPRRSSMDHYLADLAQERGARIVVSHPIQTRADLVELKKGGAAVIMATGLHIDGYEAAGVPYQKLNGYFAKGRVPWDDVRTTIYFDDYSPDYAFTCSVNGIGFALIFNRHREIEQWEYEKFAHQTVELDGYPFRKWMPLEIGGGPGAQVLQPPALPRRDDPGGDARGHDGPHPLLRHARGLPLRQDRRAGGGRPGGGGEGVQAAQRHLQAGAGAEAAAGPPAQPHLPQLPGPPGHAGLAALRRQDGPLRLHAQHLRLQPLLNLGSGPKFTSPVNRQSARIGKFGA